jgi:uncharacterized protein (TIGR00255 family)
MITSMTGFASVTHEAGALTVTVTLRSVNHRHLDLQCRLPASLQATESELRAQVQRAVSRGRIEAVVAVQTREATTPVVELNDGMLLAVDAALASARARGLVEGVLTPGDVLRLPGVLQFREARDPDDPEALQAAVEVALAEALDGLNAMRRREGVYLSQELDTRMEGMRGIVTALEGAAAEGESALQRRLDDRLQTLRLDPQVDAMVLAQEVVRFVARSDVREELVRLRAHLGHWQQLVDGAEPTGRKLDFLLQEMNREVNTIGAKAEGTRVSELVVAAKAELEKMREQVQNVE